MNLKNVDKSPSGPLPTNIRGFTWVKSRGDAGDTIGCKGATAPVSVQLVSDPFLSWKIETWTGSIFYRRYSWNITKLWLVLFKKKHKTWNTSMSDFLCHYFSTGKGRDDVLERLLLMVKWGWRGCITGQDKSSVLWGPFFDVLGTMLGAKGDQSWKERSLPSNSS